MKGKIVLFSVCFLMLQSLYSQSQFYKNLISLSIGSSIPIGHFSSTNSSDKYSGYANIGETANLSFVHKLNKDFGLVAMLYAQRNGLKTNTLAQQFAKLPFPGYSYSNGSYSYNYPIYYAPNWMIDKKSWYLASVLFGITGDIFTGFKSKFSFTAKALIGIANAQLPKLNGSSKTDTSYAIVTENKAFSFGLSYLAGIEVKYKCTKKLYIVFSTEYFGATQIDFKNVTETLATTRGGLDVPHVYSLSNSALPAQVVSITSSNKQPIGSVNINLGLALSL